MGVIKNASKDKAGDAGYDMSIIDDVILAPGDCTVLRTKVCTQGINGIVMARSGTYGKHGVLIQPTLVDENYTGALRVWVHNPTNRKIYLHGGDVLAQLVPIIVDKQVEVVPVNSEVRTRF